MRPTLTTVAHVTEPPTFEQVPPLENGDRLTRLEFERRYEAMPELRDKNAAKHHVGRFGDPEHDAGEAAAYLISDRGSFVTGTTLHIDGGMCL